MSQQIQPTLATHNGTFHADESLAIFLLSQLPKYANAKILRSRDPAVLATAEVVVDVGGVYDHNAKRYDHHQRGFEETIDGKNKLSSAGLIYRHYGHQVIAKILSFEPEDPRVEVLYQQIYTAFILALDCIDNGVSAYPPEIEPRYRESTNLCSRVAGLLPWWNEEFGDDILDQRFTRAIELTGLEFTDKVRYYGLAWLPARSIVEEAITSRYDVDSSGKIIQFHGFCPWKDHLHQLEVQSGIRPEHLPVYVIYPDGGSSPSHRVQAVSIRPGSFESRLPLPSSWRGLRDSALDKVSGVPGGIFCHASGFIAGFKSLESALHAARLAVSMQK